MKIVSSIINQWHVTLQNGKRKTVPRKKVWKLHKGSIRCDFNCFVREVEESNEVDVFAEVYYKALKGAQTGQQTGLDLG